MAPPADSPSVKTLSETPNLTSIPPSYIFSSTATTPNPSHHYQPEDQQQQQQPLIIPTVDFSLLTSATPHQRSKLVADLGKACENWGFFMVTNHGVREELVEKMMESCREFFDMEEKEKQVYGTKHVLDPIRYGTSFNTQKEQVFFWRDYLKIMVHPQFHSPDKPTGFREISEEYCKKVGEVTRELLRAISESLGLEACNLETALNMESCFQLLAVNLYPPCPQPELAMGLPPHSDHCLLTVLLQNAIGGLQILHNHTWLKVHPVPNSFLVNVADQLEIFSNGKYKSVLHRATVNDKATRMSIALAIGPSFETLVGPSPELVDSETNPPLFKEMRYKDYMEAMQDSKLHFKSSLDRLRIV